MLFGFRGVRFLQVILAIGATVMGVGAAIVLKAFSDKGDWYLLPIAVVMGLVFIWMFGLTMRLPTSFVAVSPERTRIRFGGFVDTVVDNGDILGARLAHHPFIGGLGVRTAFNGTVTLTAASGMVAELVLRKPVRIWLIPRLWPCHADHLRVGVRNPEKLVERFGEPRQSASSQPSARSRRRRGRRK